MSRAPILQTFAFQPGELVVDNFAGGGGASTGIEAAIGRPVDIAINHDPEAIAMHQANHPETKHFCENIWEVDPKEACGSRPVGLAWFSPDCTHFSRAKGSQPREQGIRGLAWVVIRWARAVAPRVIVLENVEEFQTWGPLLEDGRPDPEQAGETFRDWLSQLASLGYTVEFRSIVAADYGAPTTRQRLFLVARRDGFNPAWPRPTHGKGCNEGWHSAAEVIDWSLPCPSIFDRARPLAEATLRRIAAGIRKYVIEALQPFIVKYHGGQAWRGQDCEQPLHTVDTANRYGIVCPFVVRHGHYSTITGAGLEPGRGCGTFRGQSLSQPLATICATNDKHLVVPLVTAQWGNSVGRSVEDPLGTVTAIPHHYLTAAFVTKHYGGVVGHDVNRPLGVVTGRDHHALTAAFLTKFYGTSTGADAREPLPTVTANRKGGGHLAEVRAFLIKYYGAGGAPQTANIFTPLHTVTAAARFGLGVVLLGGETYQIVDIGMRMLQPHELFAAQGFPASYVIDPEFHGKPLTKTAQIKLAGNSVCPPVAQALVAAQGDAK